MGARGDVARLKKIGFGAYLTKPIKQSQLYDCLATTAKIWKEKKQLQDATIVTRHSLPDNKKQGIRILLAEDDATNQKVALHILKKFGYRADAVENGQGVLEALEKIPYDVVLMDIQMPVMDGFEATAEIRKIEKEQRRHDKKMIVGVLNLPTVTFVPNKWRRNPVREFYRRIHNPRIQ